MQDVRVVGKRTIEIRDNVLSARDVELKWNHKDLESMRICVEKYVQDRRAVVQAGACLGVFPEWLSGQFDSVYTFEPDSTLHRATCERVARCSNVVVLQAALGRGPRLVRTECSLRPNDGKSVLHEGMTRTEPDGGWIPTLTIDSLGLQQCDLVYLDVEGDELFALLGAQDTLRRCRPVVAVEINRGISYRGLAPEDLRTFLRMHAYEFAETLRSDEVWTPRESTR